MTEPVRINPGSRHSDPGWTPVVREPWMDQALCTQVDPELFFPIVGSNVNPARRVCRECPVRAECLAYALEHDLRHGVWGGTSERQRERLRAGHGPRPYPQRPIPHGTAGGYQAHLRRRVPACDDCLRAYRLYRAERRGGVA